MELLSGVINSLPFLLTIITVALLKRIKLLDDSHKNATTSILFNLAIPALIIKLLSETTFDFSNSKFIIFGILLWSLSILFGIIFFNIFRVDRRLKGSLVLSFIGFAVGPVVYPLMPLNYTSDAFVTLIVADLMMFLLMMTVGYFIAIFYGNKGKFKLGESFKKIISSPIVWSIIFGVIVSLFNIDISFANSFLNYVSSGFGFLAAVLLGLTLSIPSFSSSKIVFLSVFVKMFSSFIIALLLLNLLGITGEYREVLLILSLAPTPLTALVLAEKEDLLTKELGQITALSYLVGIILIPIMIGIL